VAQASCVPARMAQETARIRICEASYIWRCLIPPGSKCPRWIADPYTRLCASARHPKKSMRSTTRFGGTLRARGRDDRSPVRSPKPTLRDHWLYHWQARSMRHRKALFLRSTYTFSWTSAPRILVLGCAASLAACTSPQAPRLRSDEPDGQPPVTRACTGDSDCRTLASYCAGAPCVCRVLAAADPAPACTATVTCFADPCMKKAAACQEGRCVLVPGP
jgi:hypothetical protein